jgi:hypothetical protein
MYELLIRCYYAHTITITLKTNDLIGRHIETSCMLQSNKALNFLNDIFKQIQI